MIFYGININIKNLKGDIYFKSIIIFTMDFIFGISTGFLSNTVTFGRKKMIIILLLLSFIGYMIGIFFKKDNEHLFIEDYAFLISRLCSTCILCILSYFSTEIYPTVLRAKGLGYNIAVGKIGAILTPFFIESVDHGSLLFVFCVLNILGIILSFLLPETRLHALYHHLPEISGIKLHVEED